MDEAEAQKETESRLHEQPMNDLEIQRIKNAVSRFIEKRRPPVEMREELDIGYRFDGRSIEIFSIRPPWDQTGKSDEKVESATAKGTFRKSQNQWFVYWQRADMKWHRYPTPEPVLTVEEFLDIVDRDEYGCFFG